jgi:hypothetical protein
MIKYESQVAMAWWHDASEGALARKPVHFHSIVVHSVIALVALAAGATVISATNAHVGRFGPDLWAFLHRGSLLGSLLL